MRSPYQTLPKQTHTRSGRSRGIQEPPIPENDTPTCKREIIAAHDIVKQCCRPIVIVDGRHIK